MPTSNVVEPPGQIVVLPEMTGVGLVLIVVVLDAVPVHPAALVTVTVKVAAVFTEIVCVVAPVDQL